MKLLLTLVLAAALPMPGTKFQQLPAGKAKADVESACYACHAADILVQQRLTEKQWTATVEKMMRWGAVVPAEKKTPIIDYLSRNFGPRNRFVPIRVAPVGKS
jgi:hypothetical protein